MVQETHRAQDQGRQEEKTWRINPGTETISAHRTRVWWVSTTETPWRKTHTEA